jgi:hypothetical protein
LGNTFQAAKSCKNNEDEGVFEMKKHVIKLAASSWVAPVQM